MKSLDSAAPPTDDDTASKAARDGVLPAKRAGDERPLEDVADASV
jgi:hypothetical protein